MTSRTGSLALAKRLISNEEVHDDKWNKKFVIFDYLLNEVNRYACVWEYPHLCVGAMHCRPYTDGVGLFVTRPCACKTTKHRFKAWAASFRGWVCLSKRMLGVVGFWVSIGRMRFALTPARITFASVFIGLYSCMTTIPYSHRWRVPGCIQCACERRGIFDSILVTQTLNFNKC